MTTQVYGKQKKEGDPKAIEIEALLFKHPNLRVAYIDSVKGAAQSAAATVTVIDLTRCVAAESGIEDYYSVLIKAVEV